MSGPKTSHYTLTAEQRRILEEQRKKRRQYEILLAQQKDVRSIVVQTSKVIEQFEPLALETGRDVQKIAQAKGLCVEAMSALDRASQLTAESDLATLQELSEKIRETTGKLGTLSRVFKEKYESINTAFRAEMSSKIESGFVISFDNLGDEVNIQENPYYQKITEDLEAVLHMTLQPEQDERLHIIQEKAAEIEDVDFLKNFYAMTVTPFVKACRSMHESYVRTGTEYEKKRLIYEANAIELGIIPEQIPFCDQALTDLDNKIRETEAAIQEREEQAYISRCVDEALQEMGYSVLGDRDVVKRSGKRYHNELYLFDEGTAVNVTYSSDGQITMELGGISTENRIPTSSESAALVSDMRTFCDDYYEIEKVLRKKGVITKCISVLPPDAQFAQIIDVSGYNLKSDITEYEERTRNKSMANKKTLEIGG